MITTIIRNRIIEFTMHQISRRYENKLGRAKALQAISSETIQDTNQTLLSSPQTRQANVLLVSSK